MNDQDTTMSNYERHRKARAQLNAGNKAAVFDALAAANITRVIVEFDGEGDSGQINGVIVFRDRASADLPATTVSLRQLSWGATEPVTTNSDLHEAIERLCYDYLEESHGGWENNDGAYGEFHFDVVERSVEQPYSLTGANMAHPYHHSLSSVKKWGGKIADYQRIHDRFDESKKIIADFRHRALRHHAEGIFMAETIFGSTITLSSGRVIPGRWIGEQHVREDLGFIPSFADWVKSIRPEPWMGKALRLEVSLAISPETTTLGNNQ
jgi:hypothetical protein